MIYDDNGAVWYPTSDGRFAKGPPPNPTTLPNGMSQVEVGHRATYTFSSHPRGLQQPPDPGALNIEFVIPTFPQHSFEGAATLRLSGVGLKMIGQGANLNGQNFTFSAGMGKGLPLAKPAQAGEIIRGQIYQAYGNWQGVEQTLDLVGWKSDIVPSDGSGIMFSWQPGQTFTNALFATFQQAFPDYNPIIGRLSALLQTPPMGMAQEHTATSLTDFAQYIKELTQGIVRSTKGNDDYRGVWIMLDGLNIRASDATQTNQTVAVAFEDLIGQPTWLDPGTISFKTTLRADIQVADFVTLPRGITPPYVNVDPGAAVPAIAGAINAPVSNTCAFAGTFNVQTVTHYGNFREPGGDSWNTTFTASFLSLQHNFLNASQLPGVFA